MTPEITLDTRFDETGHAELWRNEAARQLNTILCEAARHNESISMKLDFIKAALSIARRCAEFEEIQVKQD